MRYPGKNIIRVFIVLSIIVCASFQKLPDIYASQIGALEKPIGSNWGSPVKDYLASVKTHEPAPWCAAFVHWCLDSAHIKNTVTAYSPSAQNNKAMVYYRSHWLKDFQQGDVGTIYFVTMGRIAHTFFVDKKVNASVVETVEGNSAPNSGTREGIGVFRKKRPLHTIYSISRWQ